MKSLFNFTERLDEFKSKNYAIAGAVTDKWIDGKRLHVIGTLTPSGSYAAGGDAFDFVSGLVGVTTNKQPSIVLIEGKAGFAFSYDYANKKVLVFTNTAGGANNALGEHTAAAYAAGVTGDAIRFYAIFAR